MSLLDASPTGMDNSTKREIRDAAMVTPSSSVLSESSLEDECEERCISSNTQASADWPRSNSFTIRVFMRAV